MAERRWRTEGKMTLMKSPPHPRERLWLDSGHQAHERRAEASRKDAAAEDEPAERAVSPVSVGAGPVRSRGAGRRLQV